MSLFHRRSRSASASRPQAPASASAHMAATQAFLASKGSQANLSASAAAAAALRTMTPTPTPVDQVQTRRMVQRQASLSTLPGSGTGSGRGRSRGGLQRQHSSGSMTERTFRTPSPSPSRQPSRPEPVPAPPLPNIPEQYNTSSAGPAKKKKRASSQDAHPPRVLSPPLTRPNNRGQSLDRLGSSRPQGTTQQPSSLPRVNELERTDSRNSVNFSRPLSPPPRSPALTNGDRSPNAFAKAISPVEAEKIQYGLSETANQPVKKKKKKVAAGSSEGSHLQGGTMASQPVVTPLEPALEREDPVSIDDHSHATNHEEKHDVFDQGTQFPPSDPSSQMDSDFDSNVDRTREKRAQRASGMLTKQPSIVREDWEGEQNGEASPTQNQFATEHDSALVQAATMPLQKQRQTSAANVSRKMGEPALTAKPTNQATQSDYNPISPSSEAEAQTEPSANLQVMAPQTTRGSSLSPSRSTRFSDRLSSDMAAGRKHEPLPRSVSPAKPALKHHSPSPGDPNHPHARGSSVTPSESSDISSASADGLAKRKKSVRVSFDSQPEIVGVAAAAPSTESPSKEKRGWLGLGRSRPPLNTIDSNDDMEELMKPRPQLPSFGSVRGQKSRDSGDSNAAQPPRPIAESPPSAPTQASKSASSSITSSETSSNVSNLYPTAGASSDHAVGAVLAQDAQNRTNRNPANEPLPPEVTSVHGTVSFSDSESEASDVGEPADVMSRNEQPVVESVVPPTTKHESTVNQLVTQTTEPVKQPEVPIVSVSPPTPRLDRTTSDDQWLVEVPGGFPVSSEALAQLNQSQKDSSPAARTFPQTTAPETDLTDENDSDNDSIYSDAAEDPAELDGTGFGSIDAIVDSPMLAQPPTRDISIPESPLARVSPASPQEPSPPPSPWDETQARWRNLAQQTRQAPVESLVVETKPSNPSPVPFNPPRQQQIQQPPPTPRAQPRRKKKSSAAIAAAASVPAAARDAQGRPPSQPRPKARPMEQGRHEAPAASGAPFRQSMRANAAPEAEPTIRKSMRPANRNSMPPPAAKQAQENRRPQPTAPYGQSPQPRAALQKKHLPTAAAAAVSAPRPVQPVAINDSDSDSSFRKNRRTRRATGGKHTMRSSMRGSEPSMRPDTGYSVRSSSPAGRRAMSQHETTRTMRTSMRGSVDSSVPTMRGSMEAKRSSSLFGRRQQSPPPMPSMGSRMPASQKQPSRVADSDDEDAAPQRGKWRSRFDDDSDDDAEMTQFTPVRGIPRRRDSDSTDLQDSSDNEKSQLSVQTPAKTRIPSSGAPAWEEEPQSPNAEKKRGLLGMFRSSKKAKEESPSPVLESPAVPARTDTSGKPSHLGFGSAAERDRMIEQTRAKLEASKEPARPNTASNAHHKLQRRQTPQRVMSDSWPLPPKLPASMNERPSTADGPPYRNGTTRLNQGSMRMAELPPAEAIGRGGKKKRFPMLRKAFGLKD